jgi:hypothetical protein
VAVLSLPPPAPPQGTSALWPLGSHQTPCCAQGRQTSPGTAGGRSSSASSSSAPPVAAAAAAQEDSFQNLAWAPGSQDTDWMVCAWIPLAVCCARHPSNPPAAPPCVIQTRSEVPRVPLHWQTLRCQQKRSQGRPNARRALPSWLRLPRCSPSVRRTSVRSGSAAPGWVRRGQVAAASTQLCAPQWQQSQASALVCSNNNDAARVAEHTDLTTWQHLQYDQGSAVV